MSLIEYETGTKRIRLCKLCTDNYVGFHRNFLVQIQPHPDDRTCIKEPMLNFKCCCWPKVRDLL